MSRANRKRKKMGGRPRLEGVTRDENGRISQRRADVDARAKKDAVETEKEARAVVVDARQRLYGVSEADSTQHYAGSVLGRLYLAKAITKLQFEAGEKMSADYDRYYSLTGVQHPSAKAQDISRVRGLGNDADPSKARAAADHVQKIETQLGLADVQGRPVTSICKRVCILDDPAGMELNHMVGWLKKGLTALSRFYGIDERRDAA